MLLFMGLTAFANEESSNVKCVNTSNEEYIIDLSDLKAPVISLNKQAALDVVIARNDVSVTLTTVNPESFLMTSIEFQISELNLMQSENLKATLSLSEGPGSVFKSTSLTCETGLRGRQNLLSLKSNSKW